METLLKYTHELIMFFAVAVSIGGTTLVFRLVKTDDVPAIRSAFRLLKPSLALIEPLYGIGTLLGLATAWVMHYDLLETWLVAAYVLTVTAALLGGHTKRWALKVAALAEAETGTTPGETLKAALATGSVRVIRRVDMVVIAVFLALMVFRPDFW